MANHTVVIIDDDAKLAKLVATYFDKEGFQTHIVHDGAQAAEVIKARKPDIIVLDLMLPGVDGWEICRRIRRELDTPIIMLTARDEETDRLIGLEMGADDYVTKPFSPREVVARAKAILRRTRKPANKPDKIKSGELIIDFARHEVHKNGQLLDLTPTEFRILEMLATNAGRVFSRLQIVEQVQGYAFEGYERTELRTPLAVIQGNLEGMLEGVIPADKEQLNSLYEETLYLNRIITDLRDLTLAEAGQLQLDKQPTDLGQLLVHAVAMLKPLAEEKEIELTAKLAPLPSLVIDRGRIAQAVYNLLTNAIRYTGRNGKIEVLTGALPDGVVIEVRDNGLGIDAADLPHIFDHFFRADKSRTRESGGTGIGLAIVKQIAGLHGGAVEVTSRKGEGSNFKLFLPYHHANGKAMKEARKPG
ncbi:MAG: response regulator [Negativicutes bacterium]|nr:response regulator [Negativicutes bacterium]